MCTLPMRDAADEEQQQHRTVWVQESAVQGVCFRDKGLCHSFTSDETYDTARREAFDEKDGSHLSQDTIADWYQYCRETLVANFITLQEQTGQIGGQGRIVQIDESKFGRRKYNRRRRIEGHWVLGMIEEDSGDFSMVLCPNNRRGTDDLMPIIQQHVAAGTEFTPMPGGHRGLMDRGTDYDHRAVNHSDPDHRFLCRC
ncbi:hypothetical protein Trydic_g18327 [Trypoxylus dichotomus]